MDISMNSMVKVKGGKALTMPEFADKYGLDPTNTVSVISMANILKKRGDLTVVEHTTKEEKIVNDAMQEEAFVQVVNQIDAQEEAHKQYVRNQKLNEVDPINFSLDFRTSLDAMKFENWVNELGVEETAQLPDKETGAIKLYISNVTPQEFTKITANYKTKNAINAGMNITSKVTQGTTNAVNYGLSEVVAPTAKIVGEAGMNLGKGLFHTGVKTLAGLVNSGAKAYVDTKYAIATDPDCLRASRQLIEAKNTIRRGVNSKLNQSGMGNGINVL